MINLPATFGLPDTKSVAILSEILDESGQEHRFCSVFNNTIGLFKALSPVPELERTWFEDRLREDMLLKMEELDRELAPYCRGSNPGFARNVATIWLAHCSGVGRWTRTRDSTG